MSVQNTLNKDARHRRHPGATKTSSHNGRMAGATPRTGEPEEWNKCSTKSQVVGKQICEIMPIVGGNEYPVELSTPKKGALFPLEKYVLLLFLLLLDAGGA